MIPAKGSPVNAGQQGWVKGPLPPNTYLWGGVVVEGGPDTGFFFADFCGDHVKVQGWEKWERYEAHQVKWWNNCLSLPPGVTSNDVQMQFTKGQHYFLQIEAAPVPAKASAPSYPVYCPKCGQPADVLSCLVCRDKQCGHTEPITTPADDPMRQATSIEDVVTDPLDPAGGEPQK